MTLQAGARLGPYEITAHIGSGGMGDVYRARDANLQRDVAIKVLPETFAADPDRLARFEREARAVAALSHPGILAIHDFGRSHGVVYAVMELLEGATLRSRLDAGPFPVSPDGSRVWMLGVNGRPYLYSVNGGDPGHVRPIVDTRLQKVDVRIASQRWTLPTGETLKGVRVSGLATVAGLKRVRRPRHAELSGRFLSGRLDGTDPLSTRAEECCGRRARRTTKRKST